MKTSEMFIKAVESFFGKNMTQSVLADALKVPRSHMNDFLKGRRNFSEDRKVQISEFLGKSYLEMLNLGYSLLSGESIQVEKETSTPVQPMDRAVKILRLAEEKAGIELNSKQREAVTQIIRKELDKREAEAMGHIVDMIKAFQ